MIIDLHERYIRKILTKKFLGRIGWDVMRPVYDHRRTPLRIRVLRDKHWEAFLGDPHKKVEFRPLKFTGPTYKDGLTVKWIDP